MKTKLLGVVAASARLIAAGLAIYISIPVTANALGYDTSNAFIFHIQLEPIANTATTFTLDNSYVWAATDGSNLFDGLNAQLFGTISVGTTGAVSSWDLGVEIPAFPTGHLVQSCGYSPCVSSVFHIPQYAGEYAQTTNSALGLYIGISDTPGTWGMNGNVYIYQGNNFDVFGTLPPHNPVSLPAALPLFASGLGALGLLGWRRKRRAVTRSTPA